MTRNTIISVIAAVVAIALPTAASAEEVEYDCLISRTLPRAHYSNPVEPTTKVDPPRLQRITTYLDYDAGAVVYEWEGRNVVVTILTPGFDRAGGRNFDTDTPHDVTLEWKLNGTSYEVHSITIRVYYPDETTAGAAGTCVPRAKG